MGTIEAYVNTLSSRCAYAVLATSTDCIFCTGAFSNWTVDKLNLGSSAIMFLKRL